MYDLRKASVINLRKKFERHGSNYCKTDKDETHRVNEDVKFTDCYAIGTSSYASTLCRGY